MKPAEMTLKAQTFPTILLLELLQLVVHARRCPARVNDAHHQRCRYENQPLSQTKVTDWSFICHHFFRQRSSVRDARDAAKQMRVVSKC